MKAKMVLAAALMAAVGAFGVQTNTWISGATDWSSETSYEEVCVPEPGDVVIIPAGVTATVSVVSTEAANTEGSSFDVFSKLSRVLTENTTSGIILDIAEGASVTNGCYIHGKNSKGTIIKRGLGMIEFGAQDYAYAYNVHIKVEQGVLVLPQERPTGIFYVGNLTVDKGATLITAMNAARKGELSSSPTCCYEIWGEGTISNRYNLSQRLDFRENGHTFTFGGTIGRGVRIFTHANVTALLTGTNSTFASTAEVANRATLGFMKLGESGNPSSFGTDGTVYWRGSSGTLLYLGDGETSGKNIRTYSNSDAEHILDGGANGGLTLTGTLGYNSSSPDSLGMQRVTITGSNMTPCVIKGTIGGRSHNGTNYYFHITKKGTGIWRLASAERTYPNAWSVEDGTLQFESLKQAGVPCSLGVATNLFESYSGFIDESKRVDWAFALGGAATRGTMEYVGSADVSCTSRLVVVKGKGGALKNSTGRPMVFSGVSAAAGADAEFAVAGDNVAVTNFIRDVTDGKGTASFAKDGEGTWVLGGDTSFSGSLAVRGGTLIIQDPTKYTWFRWTVKENNSSTGTHTEALELGIYDENGNRINGRLYPFTNYYSRVQGMLPEGMCSYWRGGTLQDYVNGSYRPIEALFDDGTPIISGRASYWMCTFHAGSVGSGKGLKPMLNVETNWLPIVMHLTNGIGRAASFDVCPSSTNDRKYKAFSMEGSVDGIHWDLLTNVVLAAATANSKWTFSGGSYTAGSAKTHTGGAPIAGGPEGAVLALANVESVSVADNARLVAFGGVAPIKGLTVDANGAGTIDGFAFAAGSEHTLNVVNLPEGGAVLPGTYVNCAGLENVADWGVSLNGRHTARYRTSCSGGVLRVTPIGTMISFR